MKAFLFFFISLCYLFFAQASEPRECSAVGPGLPDPKKGGPTQEEICEDVEGVMVAETDLADSSGIFVVSSGKRLSRLRLNVFYQAVDGETKQVVGYEFWGDKKHYFELAH